MEATTKIAIVGCGNISDTYLTNCLAFGLDVVACTDMDMSRAEAKAAQFGIVARSLSDVFSDPSIELIVNLTPPLTHAEVSCAALEAGKHVYSEKPLATDRTDGAQLLELAASKGLRIGCAPDTFLGAGLQTCRKLLDESAIGEPVAAVAFFMGRGMEMWHPNPHFFYQPGGGPMFDLGPYYLTALVSLLGPVRRLTGSARISFPERLITSFDVWASNLPRLEIYGSEGSLSLPDPNTFGGPVRIKSARDDAWRDVPLLQGHTENSRGLGVSEMVVAIHEDRPHRASAEMAFHILDLMQSFEESSTSGQHIEIRSRCERPAALYA